MRTNRLAPSMWMHALGGWKAGRQARIRMWRDSAERTSYIRRAHSALDGDRVVTTKTTIRRERTGLGASRWRAVWARCGSLCVLVCVCTYWGVRRIRAYVPCSCNTPSAARGRCARQRRHPHMCRASART